MIYCIDSNSMDLDLLNHLSKRFKLMDGYYIISFTDFVSNGSYYDNVLLYVINILYNRGYSFLMVTLKN